ncbi:MAG: hypothetical protein KO463_03650, partial [Candidatus Methanofastidiosa archaeon]|nr:hypothetical protein [Candidatus Methanofastidiosa archaeon]
AMPGITYYYNLKAFDTAGNTSAYGATWVSCRAQIVGEVQLLVNSDFERDRDGDGVPDEWYVWDVSTTTEFGAYGINGGKGLRWVLPASTAEVIGEAYQIYYSGTITPRLAPAVNRWYNLSCYVYVSVAQSYWHLATGYTSGKVKMYCRLVKGNGAGPDTISQDYPMEIVETRPDGWVRLVTCHLLTSSDVSGYSYLGLAVGAYAQNLASAVTVQVDRVQLEIDGPTAWQPQLVSVAGASSLPYGLQIDAAGIKTADGTFWIGADGKGYSHLLPGGASLDLGSTTLPWRDVIASRDGRLGGGLYVGSTATDPATGYVFATNGVRTGGGLVVGTTTAKSASAGEIVMYSAATNSIYAYAGSYEYRIGFSSSGSIMTFGYGITACTYGFYNNTTIKQRLYDDGDVAIAGGLSVGLVGQTTAGDILYTSNLRPYRNSTAYTGYVVVPCSPALTHYDWDGDSKTVATHTIDTSATFGCPAGIAGVFVRLLAKWASAAGTGESVNVRAKGAGTGSALAVHGNEVGGTNSYGERTGFCPCDASGDIEVVVAGALSATVIVQIVGYIL